MVSYNKDLLQLITTVPYNTRTGKECAKYNYEMHSEKSGDLDPEISN